MVSASWRSRESMNCGSVRAYWRTLKPATAVETPATPTTTTTSHTRQLNPRDTFFDSLAISAPGPQPRQQLFTRLPHAAGPQRQDRVAFAGDLQHRFHAAVQRAPVLGSTMPELPDALHQRFRRDPRDGFLRGRVNIHDKHAIGLVERARELFHEVKRPREPVWLKQHVDAPEAAQPGAVERGADLGGMVAVIVDDRDAALPATI